MDALAGLGLSVQVLILFILFIHVGFGWSRKTIENGHWGNMDTQDRQDKGIEPKKQNKRANQARLDTRRRG